MGMRASPKANLFPEISSRHSVFAPHWAACWLPPMKKPDASPAVVLSYSYWKRQFGGAPSAVGKSIGRERHTLHHCGRRAARISRP